MTANTTDHAYRCLHPGTHIDTAGYVVCIVCKKRLYKAGYKLRKPVSADAAATALPRVFYPDDPDDSGAER